MAKEKTELSKALDEHTIKTLTMIESMMTWDKIDLNEPKEVQQRCIDYFKLMAEINKRPLVMGLAMALGMDRRRLYEISRGQVTANKETHIPRECKEIIIKAYHLLEVFWESLMTENKINSVAGIFLGKNNFGYSNDVEVYHTSNDPLNRNMTDEERRARQEALEEKYLASIVTDKK